MTMPEYMSLIAARWETIGLLFAVLGTATFHIPDDDPVFTHNPWNIDRRQLRNISVAVSEICCQFCNHSGFTSDPLCWLVTQQTVLLTLMAGKSDFRTWQKLGDLSTITYAIGLHRPSSNLEEKCPFFLAEIRKRVLACAYSLDKELATTLGLPPRICSRYCCIELPLDLSYEEIIATPSEVEQALQSLDPNGWNIKGSLTLEVRLRIALLTSFMRENILELSMSHQTDDLLDRVEKMIKDSREMQQALPLFLRWTPSESESNFANESRSLTHLEFTYQEFLLYRIVLKRLEIKLQGLIDTSCEIISTLLNLTTLRTRSAKSMQDVSWDLCYMGLPAAGILTTELLNKQSTATQLPIHSRSQMIQKLSIFVSHLKSFIEPHEGIYEVAQQGASIICKVLDQVLSVGSLESVALASGTDWPENWFGNENLDIGEDDLMPWLENIGWGQDPWLYFT
ncbi:chromatin structure remodeling complex protein RSC3, putative [Talaromyces stipitatus ATCC 10500]|uniref:Chromatin structure remodeling complex protein RSC3, putative n=1 Tax=Talaromyces stipitatus (strain ATCC 10500 / CBS 375.48 / QM 6759 / NRRL 1006) TaxID=441959 RepID=B8M3A3_TALSN|nr:chromatin structure remodeling complex protein RSC3, putative [Talaromyces stipitatus ATCC 10500]EED22275.1 chromatin structure remodeling complex protein RSC3, putative [Talaromyces stipitatus ATCC 10500]